jgi:hypothetical protein
MSEVALRLVKLLYMKIIVNIMIYDTYLLVATT